ncbi:cell division protein SepF [Fusobacterium canifelinum]|uniref:Cell division protein SepF n=1 Tax=Fusobacterium canifelinum TaxID=285729 RepID=A0A3P1V296_9FUSO|nr:cell division protein SepF [Fusobacterium canifelinum]QQB73196.1 cell division protein SepF [Fusobacterium canifelinum]RRD28329.1 cell division protein SepF [Fusobacterium canifelinum]
MIDNIDIVFLKPTKFEDCVICANYIKEDKIVNMNLSQLDDNESRRVLDYIAGAIFITKAEIVNVGNKIFCSIPSNRNFLNEMNRETSHEEEEVEIVRG